MTKITLASFDSSFNFIWDDSILNQITFFSQCRDIVIETVQYKFKFEKCKLVKPEIFALHSDQSIFFKKQHSHCGEMQVEI